MNHQQPFKQHFLFKFRWLFIFVIVAFTALFLFYATQVKKSYEYFSTLPKDHKALTTYNQFQQKFNVNTNNIILGFESSQLLKNEDTLKAFQQLIQQLKQIENVESVVSIFDAVELENDFYHQQFIFKDIFDSTKNKPLKVIESQLTQHPFYNNLFIYDQLFLTKIAIKKDIAFTQSLF